MTTSQATGLQLPCSLDVDVNGKTRRLRVLLVDDDDDMRDLLAEACSFEGFDAVACGSAEEAFGLLEGIDVLITDLHLPQASGLDLCAHVAERRPGIARVVLSGDGLVESAVVQRRAAFLRKPVALPRLFAKVRELTTTSGRS